MDSESGSSNYAGYENYDRPSVAVDAVVFGVESYETSTMEGKRLKILLVKRGEEPFKGCYSLPGGFLRQGETAEEAVERELLEETGTRCSRLIPLKVYSGRGRDPRGWIISTSYISLMNTVALSTRSDSDAACAVWLDVRYESEGGERIIISDGCGFEAVLTENGSSDAFAFDHSQIIFDGFRKLQDETRYHDIIFDLMPETFTVSGLHEPYRMILGKNETVQAFRKRMSGKIVETDMFDNTKMAHRKSKLYRRRKD
ncbi:MAG: NUDIX hydrolase [Oscillospiraceae bacterium]|nr:NUDIX hydrolase [Oscillospiraceae bacterium]